jgi:hypothetical protein
MLEVEVVLEVRVLLELVEQVAGAMVDHRPLRVLLLGD